MASLANLRQDVYNHLYSAFPLDRPFETLDTAGVTPSGTTVTVTDGTDWAEGDIIEWTDDGDQALVTAVAGNNLTVIRDYNGTTGATHAANTLVRKNSRFTIEQIDEALSAVMSGMSKWGIHGFNTGSITLAASQWFYELSDTDIDSEYGVLSVYYVDDTTKEPVPLPFKYMTDMSTADADWTQGRGIRLYSKGDRSTTASDVYYTYAQSYDLVGGNLTSQVANVLEIHDELLILGAVNELLSYTIIPMTQDPGQRTDRSVPPGQTARDLRAFQVEYFIKLRAAAAQLAVRRSRLPKARYSNRVRRWQW